MHGGQYNSSLYNIGEKSKNIPRNIENGIYFVIDRFADRYTNEKDINIISRNSCNVTVTVLDINTKKLYVYELDT
jgi:hypothetical protein